MVDDRMIANTRLIIGGRINNAVQQIVRELQHYPANSDGERPIDGLLEPANFEINDIPGGFEVIIAEKSEKSEKKARKSAEKPMMKDVDES